MCSTMNFFFKLLGYISSLWDDLLWADKYIVFRCHENVVGNDDVLTWRKVKITTASLHAISSFHFIKKFILFTNMPCHVIMWDFVQSSKTMMMVNSLKKSLSLIFLRGLLIWRLLKNKCFSCKLKKGTKIYCTFVFWTLMRLHVLRSYFLILTEERGANVKRELIFLHF